jgi:hypothetical protein
MAAKLKYDIDWYTPANIKNFMAADPMNVKLVRAEYTRLRDIEQKRIKRMGEHPEYRRTQVYKQNAGKYPKLADIKGGQLPYKLSALQRFVTAKASTITGMKEIRAKQLETLHKHEYNFVTEENLSEFGEFMEEFRAQKLDEQYDSGDAADTFYMVQKHGLDPLDIEKEFNFWLENHKEAAGMKKSTGKYAGSAAKLRRRVEAKQARSKKKRNTKRKRR